MKKRFVVCIDSSTKEQHDLFREFIRNEGLAWWHWVTNVWLLVDRKGQFSASDIRDQVSRCYPNVDALVLELRADESSGRLYRFQ